MRPKWDEYFLSMTEIIKTRSTCKRRQVGAILVRDKHIVSTGYNGAPSGQPHCIDIGCIRDELNIPSGQGLDICLSGNTVIKLLDGTYKTIKELSESGEDVWLYSVDTNTGCIVPALATNPRITKYVDQLTKITLDNGSVIECTDNHKLMLRDGIYKEAKDLIYGDSLMPMYYNYSHNNGYESISNTIKVMNDRTKYDGIGTTYSTPTHVLVYEHYHGTREYGNEYVIHHINKVHTNNIPSNLICITKSEHAIIHADDKSYEFYSNMAKKGAAKQKEMLKTDINFYNKKVSVGRTNMNNNWNNEEFVSKSKERNKVLGKLTALLTNSDPLAIRSRQRAKVIKSLANIKFNNNNILDIHVYRTILNRESKLRKKTISVPKEKTILKYFDSIEEAISLANIYNHKVVSVEVIDVSPQPVYDITVPDYENFAIDLGDNSCVFVHNCKAVHAEQNAIIQAAYFGLTTNGCTLYSTTLPCNTCAKIIINAGITKVVYVNDYTDTASIDLLKSAGVKVVKLKIGRVDVRYGTDES